MAIAKTPVCRLCRREGVSICGKLNCALKRRNAIPGEHGGKRAKKMTGYGLQLREKQKAKRLYNLSEKQFKRTFLEASKAAEVTGLRLLQLLETRADNVVYRLGFAQTRRQARQMVSHGLFKLNGKRITIPSIRLAENETLELKLSADSNFFTEIKERVTKYPLPGWLALDVDTMSGKVLKQPERTDMEEIVTEQLIVEFYSR